MAWIKVIGFFALVFSFVCLSFFNSWAQQQKRSWWIDRRRCSSIELCLPQVTSHAFRVTIAKDHLMNVDLINKDDDSQSTKRANQFRIRLLRFFFISCSAKVTICMWTMSAAIIYLIFPILFWIFFLFFVCFDLFGLCFVRCFPEKWIIACQELAFAKLKIVDGVVNDWTIEKLFSSR